MAEVVVCIRMFNGDDVLAFIVGERDNKILVEHPHFVKYDTTLTKLGLVPYCLLTNETYFEIDRSKVDFVVTASEDVSRTFTSTLNTEYLDTSKPVEQDYVHMGNDTVH